MKVGDLVHVKCVHSGKFGAFVEGDPRLAIIIADWGKLKPPKAFRVMMEDGTIKAALVKDMEVIK